MHLHIRHDLVRRCGWSQIRMIGAMYYRPRKYFRRYGHPVPDIVWKSESESENDTSINFENNRGSSGTAYSTLPMEDDTGKEGRQPSPEQQSNNALVGAPICQVVKPPAMPEYVPDVALVANFETQLSADISNKNIWIFTDAQHIFSHSLNTSVWLGKFAPHLKCPLRKDHLCWIRHTPLLTKFS